MDAGKSAVKLVPTQPSANGAASHASNGVQTVNNDSSGHHKVADKLRVGIVLSGGQAPGVEVARLQSVLKHYEIFLLHDGKVFLLL